MKLNRTVKAKSVEFIDKYIFSIILATLLLIPLLMRTVVTQVYSPLILSNPIRSSYHVEFFDYPRFILLIVLTLAILSLFIIRTIINNKNIVRDKLTIIWGLLYGIVLLSVIFAQYKTLSIIGQFGLYEGALAFICYLLIFYVCAHINYDLAKLRYILNVLTVIVIINTVMGLLSFIGIDIFQYAFIKGLLTSDIVEINQGGYISSTYNNPNYASGISAVFFMIFYAMTLLEDSKKRWFYLAITCLSFAFLLSALSTSGFLTIVVLIPLAIIIVSRIKPIRKNLVTILVLVAICTVIYIPMAANNPEVHQESFGFVIGQVKKIICAPSIAYASENTNVQIKIKSTEMEDAFAEVFDLPVRGIGAGSGRVYIWSKTWELIKEKPLFGYGMGTLALYFDNNDPDKIASLNSDTIIVSKPHNYYLGLAFGIGITGLLCYLALVILHILDILKAQLTTETRLNHIHLSLFFGVLAYLFQTLFNDSVIGMSIIFWVIFGISVGLLRQSDI